MKEAVEQRIAEMKKVLMNGLDYRALNCSMPHDNIARLVYEILEVECISKELQAEIGKIFGKRWLKRRSIFE